VDRRDGRRAEREEATPHVAPPAYDPRDDGRRRGPELPHVATGRERGAAAAEDEGAHVRVVVGRAERGPEVVRIATS
jgi:hypothetical protein